MNTIIRFLLAAVTAGSTVGALAQPLVTQTPPVIGGESLPPAKLIAEAPVPDALARGVVIIPYRAENMRIMGVFGPQAAQVTPRIGHLHVTVDDNQWRWMDASGLPVIVSGLSPGPHKVQLELENPIHQTQDSQTISFVIPAPGR